MHFRYRNVANIYLELFVGGGYADITSIVRGTQRLINSVPCVTELKAGRRADRNAGRALEQAGNYVNGCPVSSISIPTLSPRAVCAGVNFDFGNPGRLQLGVRAFLAKGSSLMERLFEPVEDEEIGENVRDYLLHPAFGVPAVPGIRNRGGVNARDRRIFLYTSGFAFASIAFAKGTVPIEGNRAIVDKHLFHYDGNAKMLDEQRYNTQVNIGGSLTILKNVRGKVVEISPEFESLMKQLSRIKDLKLIIFDPLASFIHADLNADPAVGDYLMCLLSDLACSTGASIITAHHMRKLKGEKPISIMHPIN